MLVGPGDGDRAEQLRINPAQIGLAISPAVTVNGDWEVAFHLNRPQPAFLTSLAGGFSVIYPCHVPPQQMRQHPIGTGPFKFLEFKPNEDIKVVRNPEYWKQDRPYLDGIEYTIIKDPSTATLAFSAGNFDLTFPYLLTIPMMKNIESQTPQAICELNSGEGINRHLLINYHKPPFDNPQLRQAMTLALDRSAFVDIITQGQGKIGGVLQPPPGGLWGLAPEQLQVLPGLWLRREQQPRGGPADHAAARLWPGQTTRHQGYRPQHPVLSRPGRSAHRPVEAGLYRRRTRAGRHAAIFSKDHAQGLHGGSEPADQRPGPRPASQMFYGCGSSLNWDGYCNPEVDKLIELQSREGDPTRRKNVLAEIERRLAADNARPILFYARGATCRQPYVKGLTIMANSLFNGWRMEDVWLDK